MEFLQTRHAKNLVLDYFRPQRQHFIDLGVQTLTVTLGSLDKKYSDTVLRKLSDSFNMSNTDEFLFRFGIGYFRPEAVREILDEKAKHSAGQEYVINSADGHKYVIASCCNPIPGDPVVGFLAPDGSITVHKKTCSVAEDIATKHGNWIVMPKWESATDQSFLVRISLKGIDRIGLLNDLTGCISVSMGVNMRQIHLAANDGIFEGFIDLLVHNRVILEKVLSNIMKVKGLQNVMRTDL